VVDAPQVPRIVRMLDHLKQVASPHIFACPADLGPTFALFFDYPDGTTLLITVASSGCRFATNGRITRPRTRGSCAPCIGWSPDLPVTGSSGVIAAIAYGVVMLVRRRGRAAS